MERPAWHLILENQQAIAIAQQQVVEYLHQSGSILIPDCAERCQQVLVWRNRIVPLLGACSDNTIHQHVLIILYTRHQRAETVALALQSPPQPVVVRNQDQCEPDLIQQSYWQAALQCCVQLNQRKIALVNFANLS